MDIVITGSSRGLGLGFVEHYLHEGHRVFALARDPKVPGLASLRERHPDRLVPIAVDVVDPASIAAAAIQVGKITTSIDLLINNAGRYGKDASLDEPMDWDDMVSTFRTNALGPIMVTQGFLALLEKGHGKKIAHVTSLMGSIQDNASGHSYGYRLSKAALNMANKNLAIELRTRGITSHVLHPGWVRTDMGGSNAPLDIATSIRGMTQVIQNLSPSSSGGFFNYDGKPLPY